MSVKSLANILELPEAEVSSEIENIRPELAKIGLGLIYQNNDQNKIKESLIVSFLALLEIMKQGKIDAEEVDGDIRILKKEI